MRVERRGLARLATIAAMFLVAACEGKPPPAAILLFVGQGTSIGDVAAMEDVLRRHHFSYSRADTGQLNGMSQDDLGRYRLLIIPGGNFVEMGNQLTPAAAAHVRSAVRGGLNYLGLCGGAFLAGNSPYNGLNLTGGVQFKFYAAEARGVRKSAVRISFAEGAPADHYWEDGPELSGWGDVVAKYPDGTPAVVEGAVGEGWLILTGIHPEAPESWRRGMTFATAASADQDYAATLVRAAITREPLPHY